MAGVRIEAHCHRCDRRILVVPSTTTLKCAPDLSSGSLYFHCTNCSAFLCKKVTDKIIPLIGAGVQVVWPPGPLCEQEIQGFVRALANDSYVEHWIRVLRESTPH